MNDVRKCEVCGKIDEVKVACTAFGPISLAYCEDCLRKGYEPYKLMLVYFASASIEDYSEIPERYREIVKINLEFHGKTMEEFNNDLVEEYRIQEEMWNNYESESVAGLADYTEL